ncbi:uncharacterized protein LOC129176927 [Dunckerocampus dactyliophorus]|uniref:uncharacterized protein LOC129176927 n=1 Tax=Dunckerocampus dactyliophorus TaxID=161453 RepID=UPI0024055354|nr:uncharacterized protein LOC129176927 [Dunckerocampus dactyliophorus]
MKSGLILLVAACVALALPTAQGTAHLSFSNDTEVTVTRNGCGETILCLEIPDDCEPDGNATCLFASFNATASMEPNSFDLYVSLSGMSMGYIALALTQKENVGMSMLFVCGINSTNNTFFFTTLDKDNNNGSLTANERNTTDIRGTVNGSLIQCNFIIPNVNTTNEGETLDGTTAIVMLGNGTVNGTIPEMFMPILMGVRVNLTDADGDINIMTLDINRDGCGETKLCVESPDDCDPQGDEPCLFTSLNTTTGMGSGFNLSVELSGNSSGFIAMGLTQDAAEGITTLYVCGINSSNHNDFFFLTLDRNNSNGNLTQSDQEVNDLRYAVDGTSIECTFTIPNANSVTTRETSDGSVGNVLLGNGTLDNGEVTTFDPTVTTGLLNFTNPNGTITPAMMLIINRDGCGTSVLCLETPNDCNPESDEDCLFTSINATATEPLTATIRLSGNSSGYVGFGLTDNATEGTTLLFACAQNMTENGTFFFSVVTRNNTDGTFIADDRVVTNVGVVNGTSIDCEFNFINLEPRQIVNQTVSTVLLGIGNVTDGNLGPFDVLLEMLVNLTDPNGVIVIAPNAGTTKRSDAMVILLSVLTVLALL